MDATLIALHAAVLAASLLQAATGIGFGVIAGPIMLMVMNSGSLAVQVTILLSLLIAVVLAPSLYRQVHRKVLGRLLLGTVVGVPLGIMVFLHVSLEVLMLLAALSVLFMALSASGLLSLPLRKGQTPRGEVQNLAIGVLSGAMSASLAMPGPVAAARMSSLAFPKETIRATILVMFVFSYSAAFAFQVGLVGLAPDTWTRAATLLPATLIGVLIGRMLVARISERAFRRLIVVVLVATSLSLFAKSFEGLLANV
jgi:uncharacterized membrane protein YfcA